MNEPTSSSANPLSTNTEESCSSESSTKPPTTGLKLSDIPYLPGQSPAPVENPPPTEQPSCTNEKEWDDSQAKYEYEFSFRLRDKPHFVTLWDDNDHSACERALCQKLDPDEIKMSETGNGFVTDSHGITWAFHKEPYKQSFDYPDVTPTPSEIVLSRHPHKTPSTSADSILAGL